MSKRETIVPIIVNRIPSFIKDEYPAFVEFIKDYYTWNEKSDNFQQILNDWEYNNDPSNQVAPFVDAILLDAGFDLSIETDPKILNEDDRDKDLTKKKSNLIHLLREFYLARGSKQSYDFLFRILFGETAKISYPREKMLYPSNSSYGNTFRLLTSATVSNSVEGKRKLDKIIEDTKTLPGTIYGLVSKTTTAIEKITRVLSNGAIYLEIEILEPEKDFFTSETVRIRVGNTEIIENLQNIAKFTIQNGGFDYEVGDYIQTQGMGIIGSIYVSATNGGGVDNISIQTPGTNYKVNDLILAKPTKEGSGFSAVVDSVDENGAILTYKIINKGYGYKRSPEVFVKSENGENALLFSHGQNIGSIRNLNYVSPYAIFDTVGPVSVSTKTGSGAIVTLSKDTIFQKKEWVDHSGFLGERCILIDSDKYQQFSYEIISAVDPNRYNSAVENLLHPVGYSKSSVIEIQSHKKIGLFK